MKYVRPELNICVINSADVITASSLGDKLATFSVGSEDSLNWALNP